ncbi:BC_2427 family protein [Lysinibacillus sp. NPDC058147]|uniref:BC_2427 family protein n=1 Tax=unclassified Lysinibacillus TaxID=2636778 RepID=UPI0036DED7CF
MQTPWINYKEMKEISSKQKYNCQIEPIEMDQASQQNSPNSDFINDLLEIEKENETSLASHLDSDCGLLIPSETNVGDEMNDPVDTDDVDETKPVGEQNFEAHLDSDLELLIPFETNVGDEMNDPFNTEEADETKPVEEQNFEAHLDFDRELTPFETNVGDEMNDPFDTGEADETKPVEEQNFEAHLDFDRELIPFETNVGDEMNDPLDSENIDETKPVEEQDFVACLDSNRELHISFETNVGDEMNDLLNIEDAEETKPMEKQDIASHLDSACELHIPSETNVEDEMNDPLDSVDIEETKPIKEQDFATQTELDSKREICSPSESDVGKEIICLIDTEEKEKNNFTDPVNAFPELVQGKVYSKTKKSPFSTHVEIDDFLHAPICGEVIKNTFDFIDPDNHLTPQFETKLFSTITDYPEQPDCRLVHSKINQILFLMKTDTYDKKNQKSNPSKSVVVPLHNTQLIKKGVTNYHSYSSDDFMHIKVPVVVGEYKIEICLEENIVFEKGIVGVKDISNEVVLTNCKFVPNQFSQSLGNGTCSALRGNLFIEGYIHQSIEYTTSHIGNAVPVQNESLIHSNQMCQNIVLEIIIHLQQAQKIRVPRI